MKDIPRSALILGLAGVLPLAWGALTYLHGPLGIWTTQTISDSRVEPIYQFQMNEQIVLLRRNMAFLWSYDDMPIPFAYYHLMNFLVFVVLVQQAFVDGIEEVSYLCAEQVANSSVSGTEESTTCELYSVPYVVAMCIALMGMHLISNGLILGLKEIGIMMSDPFVDGNNSLPTERYMDLSLMMHSKMSLYHHTRPSDSEDPRFKSAHTTVFPLSKRVEVDLKRRERRVRTRWRGVFKQCDIRV